MKKVDGIAPKKFVRDVVNKSAKRTEEKLISVIRSVKDGLYAELHGEIEDSRQEMHLNHREVLERIEKVEDDSAKRHNDVMDKLDSIAGDFRKFDEEHTTLSYRVSEHSDGLEDHDKRLRKLEKISL